MNKVHFIEGYNEVPEKIKDYIERNYTVYNAPRPLYGETWQGDFRHGIFYAAVSPEDELFHKRNQELDGYTCEIVTKETIMAYGTKIAEEYNRNLADFDYDDIVQSYVHWINRR